jgi:preprotein translocase subunit SecA
MRQDTQHHHGPGCKHDHGDENQPREPVEPFRRAEPKVGRNDECPCGSGKKYKKCCGRG